MADPFDAHREEIHVDVSVGGTNINNNVIFTETTFQSTASAQPGMCQIACRGTLSFNEGSIISIYINGQRRWMGYLMMIEKGFVLPDTLEPKTILHGVDLNILFDKLILYNHSNPSLGLTGGGTWPLNTTTGAVTMPANLPDVDYLTGVLKDTDISLISPTIRTQFTQVGTVNPSGTGRPVNPGGTLRSLFNDVSGAVNRGTPGSVIWYIDPDGYIIYKAQDDATAPFASVGDSGAQIEVRDLVVTSDVSKIKNDVFMFAGSLNPDPAVTPRPFLLFRHNSLTASINQYGRFQYSEVMPSWSQAALNARSTKILYQEGNPALRATFTFFRSGLVPGMLLNIVASSHNFNQWLPVRAVTTRFLTPTIAAYDVVCSVDTGDPWGLLLALKRPTVRGLVQPVFQNIDLTNVDPDHPPTVEPYTHVSEFPKKLGGNTYQTSYAYIRYGISVWDNGLRQTSAHDYSGDATFVETSPEAGKFKLSSTPTGKVYCAYHVLGPLVTEAV